MTTPDPEAQRELDEAQEALMIDCDACVLTGTDACGDCAVTFLAFVASPHSYEDGPPLRYREA